MSSFLRERSQYFSRILKGSSIQSAFDLTGEFSLSPHLLESLESAVLNYLRASCPQVEYSGRAEDLQAYLFEFNKTAPNISTSGMVIPKNICEKEFTDLHRALVDILRASGVQQYVENWIFPFNVRLKSYKPGEVDTGYPTEFPHTETWVGCSSRSVLFHIPLLGDLQKNSLQVWRPDDAQFDAGFMRPLKSYSEADAIVRSASRIEMNTKKKSLFLVDSALLHNTYRDEGAGLRVSIDFNAVMNVFPLDVYPDGQSLVASRQLVQPSILETLGVTSKIHAPDGIHDRYSPNDGMRHPAHVRIVF